MEISPGLIFWSWHLIQVGSKEDSDGNQQSTSFCWFPGLDTYPIAPLQIDMEASTSIARLLKGDMPHPQETLDATRWFLIIMPFEQAFVSVPTGPLSSCCEQQPGIEAWNLDSFKLGNSTSFGSWPDLLQSTCCFFLW